MTTWVSVDGVLTPEADARVDALDPGLTVGDGVFETCKVVDRTPFALTRHLRRLRRSAEIVQVDVPWTDDELRDRCAEVLAAAGDDVGRLRITVTGRPTLIVDARPQVPWAATTRVATVPWPRNARSAIAGAKSTSYAESLVARRAALAAGAHEAVLANTDGALCEGSASNVFLVVGGRLCTPSLSTGCLAGVTRELVLELVEVDERDDLTMDHLRGASEAFLTSSTRDVHPIAAVDGAALPQAPGPLTTAAADAFAALCSRTLDP